MARLTSCSLKLAATFAKIKVLCQADYRRRQNILEQAQGRLEALSPLSVLKRGFSLVSELSSGRLITSSRLLNTDDTVQIRMHDGLIAAKIIDRRNDEQR